jgi:hypothetical protein
MADDISMVTGNATAGALLNLYHKQYRDTDLGPFQFAGLEI